jgi:hypothetical protein
MRIEVDRTSASLFPSGRETVPRTHLPVSVAQIYEMARTNPWGAMQVAVLLYFLLLPGFRRVLRKTHVPLPPAEVPAAG